MPIRLGLEPGCLSSLMVALTSFSSASSFSISSPVSLASRMLRIASLCFSLKPNRLRSLASASGGVLRLADDLDDFVDVVDRDLEPIQDVLAGLRGVEIELGPPDDDLVAVVDEVLQQLLQVHDLGRAVGQRQHDHAEGGLHLRCACRAGSARRWGWCRASAR